MYLLLAYNVVYEKFSNLSKFTSTIYFNSFIYMYILDLNVGAYLFIIH